MNPITVVACIVSAASLWQATMNFWLASAAFFALIASTDAIDDMRDET